MSPDTVACSAVALKGLHMEVTPPCCLCFSGQSEPFKLCLKRWEVGPLGYLMGGSSPMTPLPPASVSGWTPNCIAWGQEPGRACRQLAVQATPALPDQGLFVCRLLLSCLWGPAPAWEGAPPGTVWEQWDCMQADPVQPRTGSSTRTVCVSASESPMAYKPTQTGKQPLKCLKCPIKSNQQKGKCLKTSKENIS